MLKNKLSRANCTIVFTRANRNIGTLRNKKLYAILIIIQYKFYKIICYKSGPKSRIPHSAIGTYLSSIFTSKIVLSTCDRFVISLWQGTHLCTT